ncbi:MAG: hypothetical protein LBH36_01275 [Candidatus Nomurabacteria bacterium]|jgi:hypothetical protein|nr:hypothetical protein [Candidatus Nomurabacteria bacterium]
MSEFVKPRRFSSFAEFGTNFTPLKQEGITFKSEQKTSQKPDRIFAREILAQSSELPQMVQDTLTGLVESDEQLPFLHFTNDEIVSPDGTIQKTDNVENILRNGFRPMDSNVGGFSLSGGELPNNPANYLDNPELFVRKLVAIFNHYKHHGSRSNHPGSNGANNQASSKAALILINGKVHSIHGTDYLDHYILKDGAKPAEVISVMYNLPNTNSPNEMAKFTIDFLDKIKTTPSDITDI